MSERMNNAVGDTIESILRADLTPGEQSRFEGIVERLLESPGHGDQWLAASIMDQVADRAEAEHLAWEEGRVWNLYGLGRVGESGFFYIGISQDVAARYKTHLKNARRSSSRHYASPVYRRIRAELEPNGPGVRVETLLPALTKEMAKSLETALVTEMVKNGADLENRNLRGQHSPPNRHPPGSPESTAAYREYSRDRRAADPEYREAHRAMSRQWHRERRAKDPAYQSRELAKGALWQLGQGRQVTPRRIEVITLAGRASDALTILRSQGREDEWPRDGPMD